jgi:hypothetical protein
MLNLHMYYFLHLTFRFILELFKITWNFSFDNILLRTVSLVILNLYKSIETYLQLKNNFKYFYLK